MEKNLENIYLKLESEGLFNKYLTLYLLDLPDESLIKKINVKSNQNEIFVFARGFNDKLKQGVSFDVLFSRNNIKDYIECNAILKSISVNPKYNTDYLPSGYSGICMLEFENEKPLDLIGKLPRYNSKPNETENNKLILTQRPVINELINELKMINKKG